MEMLKRMRAKTLCAEQVLRAGVLMVLFGLPGLATASELFSPMLTLRMGDRVIELQPEQLAALPQVDLKTSTTLNEGSPVWQGPLARDVLALLDIPAGQVLPVRMLSWDDYRVDLTTEDFNRWDVILAHQMNDKALTVTELGPLRVVYPRDQHAELQDSRFDHRWVWMLREIVVNP